MNPLSTITLIIGAISGAIMSAALIAPIAYTKGESAAIANAKAAALETTIELLTGRELTNAEISASDAAALCAHLGLQDSDRDECVRRVAETDSHAGNGSARNHE